MQSDGKIVVAGDFDSPHNMVARFNADGTLDFDFNPNANNVVLTAAVQADGKILIGGWFTTVGGTARNRIARLNSDGTLDSGFNPDVGGLVPPTSGIPPGVLTTAIQTDGKIVIGGTFTTVAGTVRNNIARLNANGTLDIGFNPDVTGGFYPVSGIAVQTDGKIIIGGEFTSVGGASRNRIARLVNDPATQSLSVPSAGRVQWLRGGASPEAQDVAFDLSTDGGTTWTALGNGTRITGGWERAGLNLPASGLVRARARVTGGQYNGSTGLVEAKIAFSGLTPVPRLTGMTWLSNGAFQFGFTNLSGVTFTALGTTNLTVPLSNWTVLGPVTEIVPGQFQFTDRAATNFPYRFYQIRSP